MRQVGDSCRRQRRHSRDSAADYSRQAHTLTITTSQWANAISVLKANGIVSLLDAHTIRIPTATEQAVVKLLTPLAADMELGWAPASLE